MMMHTVYSTECTDNVASIICHAELDIVNGEGQS